MWKSILVIKLETYWKFTPELEGQYFRLRHIEPPKVPVGWIGQAEGIANTDFNQLFQIQRLNGLVTYEIIEYKKPAIFQSRKLAFRQELRVLNNWLIEVEASLMPSYSLEDPIPVNQSATTTKNVTTVNVTNTVTKILLANPNRKGVKFYSADKTKNVYLDTDNVVSATSAIESLTPSKPVCVPIILWTGDWYAVSSSGTVSVEIEEYL